MGIQIVDSVPHFFLEFISQSDQNSDRNSTHIISPILGTAPAYSYRFEIKNNRILMSLS